MSLQTDIVFVNALRADAVLMEQLPAGDVYNTTIALPDEDMDNAPLPYIIVAFDGLQNGQTTKDDFEAETDSVTVSVEIAAKTRQQLGELAVAVRRQIYRYISEGDVEEEEADMLPLDYQFSAQPVQYDSLKPCYWQTLTWLCDVKSDILLWE